jgi:hypothetical protein
LVLFNAPMIYILKKPILLPVIASVICQSQTTRIRIDKKSDSETCYKPVFLFWQVSGVPGELPAPGGEGVPPRGVHPLQDARQFSPQH